MFSHTVEYLGLPGQPSFNELWLHGRALERQHSNRKGTCVSVGYLPPRRGIGEYITSSTISRWHYGWVAFLSSVPGTDLRIHVVDASRQPLPVHQRQMKSICHPCLRQRSEGIRWVVTTQDGSESNELVQLSSLVLRNTECLSCTRQC